jgi:hypothetical protein
VGRTADDAACDVREGFKASLANKPFVSFLKSGLEARAVGGYSGLMRRLLATAWFAAACHGPLVVPPNEPGFDGSCAGKGAKTCRAACDAGNADAC